MDPITINIKVTLDASDNLLGALQAECRPTDHRLAILLNAVLRTTVIRQTESDTKCAVRRADGGRTRT